VDGIPLLWFNSYLTNRSQSVSVDGVRSKSIGVGCSVPQGSVLGPPKFISYTEDVADVFTRNLVSHHLVADDMQLYRSGMISEFDNVCYQLCRCVSDIRDWCSSRRLQLNASETELQWFGSRANVRKLSSDELTLSVGDDVIKPVTIVRDFDACLDAELTTKQHINRVVSSCFNVKSVVLLAKKSPSVWSLHLYSADSTTATLHWQASLGRLLDRRSMYRMLLLVSSLTQSQAITSLQFSCAYIGCLQNQEFSTNCVSRCISFSLTSVPTKWLIWFNSLQQAHCGLASGLPVASFTRGQSWKPSSVNELSVMSALLLGTV
jgi:Reverse transcriptase (RNA-dependent DNA polymerase)